MTKIARAPDGQVCRCLDRDGEHIHATYPADPLAQPEDAWDAALADLIRHGRQLCADRLPGTAQMAAGYTAGLADLAAALMGLPPGQWRERLIAAITSEPA